MPQLSAVQSHISLPTPEGLAALGQRHSEQLSQAHPNKLSLVISSPVCQATIVLPSRAACLPPSASLALEFQDLAEVIWTQLDDQVAGLASELTVLTPTQPGPQSHAPNVPPLRVMESYR